MDRLMAMRVFVAVADGGSQSQAAEVLALSRPVVSRYLAELEAWFGVRLMHRTTRRLSLTAAGKETLDRCRQMLELADDMHAAVALPDASPQGQLRVTASTSFGHAQLGQAVAAYVKRHPGVSVDLLLLDRAVNLVDERIDLAIRISAELDPNLIARKLCECRSVLCASPAYVREHGSPRQVRELAHRNCLTHSYFGKSLWAFVDGEGEPHTVAVSGNISANDAGTLLSATLAGAGIALLPTYLVSGLVRSGELLALLPGHTAPDMGIHAVYSSRKLMPATLRSLLDFLAEYFNEPPAWDLPPLT